MPAHTYFKQHAPRCHAARPPHKRRPLNLAAGTSEGSVVLFAPDPRRRITRRFNLTA